MNERILSALNSLKVAELTRADWISVGMALKQEGLPVTVWDEWSRNDKRYKPGECARLWEGFRGSGTPVTAGTILKLARDRGWEPPHPTGPMAWDAEISYDGPAAAPASSPAPRKPGEDLALYLETLFEPTDRVAYVTGEVWQNEEGKWLPRRGVYSRTAAELLAGLRKYPDDPGATVGDWKEEAGAWIRFNPVDGKGVKNENVTRFTYALVESDTLPIPEQERLYRELELPIAALVHSGGKSLHAIVHVDADSLPEYRKRVDFLYSYLEAHGLPVDRQNSNPSRLSRMPGITRNGRRQYLMAVNLGRKNWADWMMFAGASIAEDGGLPDFDELYPFEEHPPEMPVELIQGILRMGHKLLISGSSKAGKSFLLMELCIAIASGLPWLGFPCRQGKVLYVNLEIDPASCIHRFLEIFHTLGLPAENMKNIKIWNLRGHAAPLDQLVPTLVKKVESLGLSAIIIDPIYKVITGEENSATDMAVFCNEFDKICNRTGCSVIYCHHHSKGAQGAKRAMDRASGSGVFARDPDAQLDMIELELSEEVRNRLEAQGSKATAWRLESSLREFENVTPVNFWFEYPIHRLDREEELRKMPSQGSPEAGRMKNRKSVTAQDASEKFRNAFDLNASLRDPEAVSVKEMAKYLDVSEQCIYNRLKRLKDEFRLENERIFRVSDGD